MEGEDNPLFQIFEFPSSSEQEISGDNYLEFLQKTEGSISNNVYSYELLVNIYYLVNFVYNDEKRSHVKTGLMKEIRESIVKMYPEKAEFDQYNNPILKIKINSEFTSCPAFPDCPACPTFPDCKPCQSEICPTFTPSPIPVCPDDKPIISGLSGFEIFAIVFGSLSLVTVVIILIIKYRK